MPISTSQNVLTIGHSLVGKTIPDMMNSMGHAGRTDHQVINGAPLVNSWLYADEDFVQGVNARETLATGDYGAVIMTEAIPLETNVEWNDTAGNALNFVNLAYQNNPQVQAYLYETWHGFNFYNGDIVAWRADLDAMSAVWEGVVDEVNADLPDGAKEMLVIPAGQAMAHLYDAIEAGRISGVTSIRDFFSDNIHTNTAGSYYVTMVHQAALYGVSPLGLSGQTFGEHGPMPAISPEMAAILQTLAWETINAYDRDGVNDDQPVSPQPPIVPDPEPVNTDILGTSRNDVLNGSAADDRIFGFQGNDVLNGRAGADRMVGGAGNDIYFVDNAADLTVEMRGYGVDTVRSTISTTLAQNVENLTLLGTGNLNGSGNALHNVLVGNAGQNVLRGGDGHDRVFGGAGADVVFGGNGNDTLNGGDGYDRLFGGAGNDVMDGGNGNDSLLGGAGHDVLRGGNGNDVLRGETGADIMFGGAGKDLMFGGDDAGRDVFVFRTASESRFGPNSDVVYDFVSGVDKFDFRQMDADVRMAGQQDMSFSRSVAAHSIWTVRDGEDTIVRGDVNGDRIADFAIRVDDAEALRQNDFWL